jgi:hypothetical protein
MTLVEFLRARLDHVAHVAESARHGGEGRWHQTDPEREDGRIEDERGDVVVYDEGSPSGWEAEHIALHDPAAELAEVDAKRRIVDWLLMVRRGEAEDSGEPMPVDPQDQVLRLLALPYAAHPDYDESWRP